MTGLSVMLPDVLRADHNPLPLRPKILGWECAGTEKVFTRQTIFDSMDGGGEVYLAYDFRRLLAREYARAGAPRLVAEVYQMASSEDAYGIFTHDTDGQPAEVGQMGLYSAGLLRFWKGHFFVRLQAEDDTPEVKNGLLALAKKIAAGIPQEGGRPALLAALPPQGLLPPSIHYFNTVIALNLHYLRHGSSAPRRAASPRRTPSITWEPATPPRSS